jgi:hypothetical protein
MRAVRKISEKMNIKLKYAVRVLHTALFSLLLAHWINMVAYAIYDFRELHMKKYKSLF